ncbi:MAG: DUF3332 domain-containing protein [Prevotellaceae bacterium]|jgi:hypothetical protein|nr:DUF3332 domain-containing protein [Prevotellaceae bacterium]
MKKRFFIAAASFLVGSTLLFNSCIGSFALTNRVLDWNKELGNKFVNEVVFLAFHIIPVYEITILGDIIILNLIEFWTGSNPIGMNEGDIQQKNFTENGVEYQMTATKNQMTVTVLSGSEEGQSFTINYNESSEMLTLNTGNDIINLAEINAVEGTATVFNANGTQTVYTQESLSAMAAN